MGISYRGLEASEFDDIDEAVLEAMAFVMNPIRLLRQNPETPVDPLYGESVGGDDVLIEYAALRASVKEQPTPEYLTRYGIKENADLLAFIPAGMVTNWELETGQTFTPTGVMELEYRGTRFNITRIRQDDLPVGDGLTSRYIGLVVIGTTKPHK